MDRALVLLLVAQLGCAQLMVVRQAPPLDRSTLELGAARGLIAATLGAPTASEEDPSGGQLTDTYVYTDGGKVNTWWGKAGRILLYSAGDFFTLFLTQILWMPAEIELAGGTDYKATVGYERRPADQRWVAAKIVETKRHGGEVTMTIEKLPQVAAAPPGSATPQAGIGSGGSTATCFAIDPDGHLLSVADAVSNGAASLKARWSDGRQLTAQVVNVSRATGLALLQVEGSTSEYLPLGDRTPPEIGDRVFAVGFAGNELHAGPSFAEGSIASLSGPGGDTTYLHLNMRVLPGQEGSPVVNQNGEVVGIVAMTGASEALRSAGGPAYSDTEWAVRADYAIPLVGTVAERAPAGSWDEAVRRTRGAVCQVIVGEGALPIPTVQGTTPSS